MKTTLERFDALRLDHFIGFHRYWEIPASAQSARDGRFVGVPGEDFFEKIRSALGHLPFIAEDLGLVTPEVGALRDRFEMPGMRVLEFAFVDANSRDYQPHRFPKQTVVYTGTHDNDTVVGWLTSHERARAEHDERTLRAERQRALAYAGSDGREVHWDMIRVALMSVANTAIFPLQDLLGLGAEARMNVPGTASGNWAFRALNHEITIALAERMANLCESYERIPADIRRTV
jgi:4-alpha-glucanotransferase